MIIRENAFSKKKKINEGENSSLAYYIMENVNHTFEKHVINNRQTSRGKSVYEFICAPTGHKLVEYEYTGYDVRDGGNFISAKRPHWSIGNWVFDSIIVDEKTGEVEVRFANQKVDGKMKIYFVSEFDEGCEIVDIYGVIEMSEPDPFNL